MTVKLAPQRDEELIFDILQHFPSQNSVLKSSNNDVRSHKRAIGAVADAPLLARSLQNISTAGFAELF